MSYIDNSFKNIENYANEIEEIVAESNLDDDSKYGILKNTVLIKAHTESIKRILDDFLKLLKDK